MNVNSINDLLIELLSLLLKRFAYQCQYNQIVANKRMLDVFVLCYKLNGHNQMIIERNLHTIHAMKEGVGRLQRTKPIAECQPLMNHILNYHTNESQSIITLEIIDNISKHYTERIENLLQNKLRTHFKRYLEITY